MRLPGTISRRFLETFTCVFALRFGIWEFGVFISTLRIMENRLADPGDFIDEVFLPGGLHTTARRRIKTHDFLHLFYLLYVYFQSNQPISQYTSIPEQSTDLNQVNQTTHAM